MDEETEEKRNRKKIEYELREMFKDYDMDGEAEEKGNRKKKRTQGNVQRSVYEY